MVISTSAMSPMNDSAYSAAQRALFRSLTDGKAEVTVVPLRDDYVAAARCLTIIARLNADLAALIERSVIAPLRQISPRQYWYPEQDLHLTIKNVRSARPAQTFSNGEVQAAARALRSVSMGALQFEVCEVARFPTSIVLGAFSSQAHRDTVVALDHALRVEGMPDDKKYLSNHVMFGNITVCRFTEPPSSEMLDTVSKMRELHLGSYVPGEIELVECDEVCSEVERWVHAVVTNEAEPSA